MHTQSPSTEINPALMALAGRPRTVLDVGSGGGLNSLVTRRSGAHVTGIEGDRTLAERTRLLLDEVIACDPANFKEVDAVLGDRRFDVVMMPDILERTPDPIALVRHYARYVEREGRLLIAVRNPRAWPVRLGLVRPELGYATADGGTPKLIERDVVVRAVESAGLEVLEVEHNPMLLKGLRGVLGESVFLSMKHGEESPTGFRDWSPYQMYLTLVRPFEAAIADAIGDLAVFQNVIVARKKPEPRKLSLTVGMLTMDEEESVSRMIDAIRAQAPDAELLVVDSSLRDRTPVIAESMGARVLRQLPPRGHGPAMELLMYEAAKQSEALIYLDCDFTYPPEDIPKIRAILEDGADVVNAARIREKPEAMPLPNYLANKTFSLVAKAMNGMNVADLHSGMRGYRSSVIRSFYFDGEGDALPIDTLLWPARSGYRVVEIPIDYQDRVGTSKLRKLAGTVWTFIRLGKTLTVGERRGDTYEVWPDAEGKRR
jgi:SAM-dependent methyltransferase